MTQVDFHALSYFNYFVFQLVAASVHAEHSNGIVCINLIGTEYLVAER